MKRLSILARILALILAICGAACAETIPGDDFPTYTLPSEREDVVWLEEQIYEFLPGFVKAIEESDDRIDTHNEMLAEFSKKVGGMHTWPYFTINKYYRYLVDRGQTFFTDPNRVPNYQTPNDITEEEAVNLAIATVLEEGILTKERIEQNFIHTKFYYSIARKRNEWNVIFDVGWVEKTETNDLCIWINAQTGEINMSALFGE